MINYYSPSEIELIRQSGKITANALKQIIPKAISGVSTLDLDQQVEQSIVSSGGKPSFKMEKGYRWATCMCVNDCVVHGIPTEYCLREGDRLGIDLGTFYKGYHSDASWTVIVGKSSDLETKRFLDVGEKALKLAILKCQVGNHVGDISKEIQENIEMAGYSCVKQLVGHGVGKQLHEDPEIPCYLRGKIENTAEIKPGMVLAVEVIYNMGKSEVVYAGNDGWTIVTRDGSLSGLFEHTVAITENGPEILTQ